MNSYMGFYKCDRCGVPTPWGISVGKQGNDTCDIIPLCQRHKFHLGAFMAWLPISERPWRYIHGGWDGAYASGMFLNDLVAPPVTEAVTKATRHPAFAKAKIHEGDLWLQAWPRPLHDAYFVQGSHWRQLRLGSENLRTEDIAHMNGPFAIGRNAAWAMPVPGIIHEVPLESVS